jgi:hypothetical protein
MSAASSCPTSAAWLTVALDGERSRARFGLETQVFSFGQVSSSIAQVSRLTDSGPPPLLDDSPRVIDGVIQRMI